MEYRSYEIYDLKFPVHGRERLDNGEWGEWVVEPNKKYQRPNAVTRYLNDNPGIVSHVKIRVIRREWSNGWGQEYGEIAGEDWQAGVREPEEWTSAT